MPDKPGGKKINQNINELPTVLNVDQLAGLLGISRAGAYNLLHRQDFPTLHIGSRLMVSRENLEKWMEQNTNQPEPVRQKERAYER